MIQASTPRPATLRGLLFLILLLLALGSPCPANIAFTPPAALNSNAASDTAGDDNISVANDGAGVWVAVWSTTGGPLSGPGDDLSTGPDGCNQDLLFARSTDNGQTWGAPALLKTNAATDNGDDLEPSLATDGKGHWVCVWRSRDSLGGTIGNDADILVACSNDNGVSWGAPAALNTTAASDPGGTDGGSNGASHAEAGDVAPHVATDGAGNWVTTWSIIDNRTGSWRSSAQVAHSTNNGAAWSAPVELDASAGLFGMGGTVAAGGPGRFVVDIQYPSGGGADYDLKFVTSSDGGATWSAPGWLNTDAASDGGNDYAASLISDGKGHWVAAWTKDGGTWGTGRDIMTARSNDDGASWSAPVLLNAGGASDPSENFYPHLTTDGAGNWLAVWTTAGGATGSDQDLLYAVSTDQGANWSAPGLVNSTAASDGAAIDGPGPYSVSVETDRAGRWLVAWASTNPLGGAIGSDYDILFAINGFSNITFTPPAALNSNAASDTENDTSIDVATNGMGVWIAVWSGISGRPVSSAGDDVVDGKNQDIFYARSLDNCRTWSAPALLKTNAATDDADDLEPDIETDGKGRWVVVWRSSDNLGGTIGNDADLLASSSTDDGSTWSAPVAVNTDAATDVGSGSYYKNDDHPVLASDGAGNWMVSWTVFDNRSGAWHCSYRVAHSSDGGAHWSAPYVLQDYNGYSGYPTCPASDGHGRWIVAWNIPNSSGGGDWDIMFSISDNQGQSWTTPKPLNTNAATDHGDDKAPWLATDGQGKWVAVWYSSENLGGTIGTDLDILTAVSLDNGETWSAPAPLNKNASSDTGDDSWPRVMSDGQGHWLTTWSSNDSLGGTMGTKGNPLYAISSDGVNWSAPAPICKTLAFGNSIDGADYRGLAATTDKMGHWLAAWSSNNDLGGTIGTDYDILYVFNTISGNPRIEVNPATLNFGDMDISAGKTAARSVTLRNTGDTALSFTGEGLKIQGNNASDFSFAGSPDISPLAPGASRTVSLVFDPAVSGSKSATLHITSSDTDQPVMDIALTGNGISPEIDISPAAGFTPSMVLNGNALTDTVCDYQNTVVTDGAGVWVAVWVTTGGTVSANGDDLSDGKNQNLYFARSTNNGATWSAPALLKTNAATDDADDIDPNLATDGQGHWVVVWRSRDSLGGTIGYDDDILVVRSSDNGVSWSAPAALNSTAINDPGGNTGSPSIHEADDVFPYVATDGVGNWVATWYLLDNRSGSWRCSVKVAHSTDNGATWSAVTELYSYAGFASLDVSVATGGPGRFLLGWQQPGGGSAMNIRCVSSTDGGASWGVPVALNVGGGTDNAVNTGLSLAGDGTGGWVATWDSSGPFGTDYDIMATHSADDGAHWSTPVLVNAPGASDTGDDLYPHLATDRAGGWLVAWTSKDSLGGTKGTDSDVLYAFSNDLGASWSAPALVNTDGATDGTKADGTWTRSVSVGTDRAGRWLVAWDSTEDPVGNFGVNYDIHYAMNDTLGLRFGKKDIAQGPTAAQTVTIRNTGNSPLSFTGTGITIQGTQATEFSFASPPDVSPLAGGASRPVQVVFDPASAGNKTAWLTITSNDADEPTIKIPLYGAGTAAPEVAVSIGATLLPCGGGPVNFGAGGLDGTTLKKTFTVNNTGSADLVTSNIKVPAGYAVTEPLAARIAPGTFDTFTVAITTTTPGTYAGMVSFDCNDSDENPYTFSVTGRIAVLSDLVWADFYWIGPESGTQIQPFNTLAEALAAVSTGGTVRIRSSYSAETMRITWPVRLEAYGGKASIGRASAGALNMLRMGEPATFGSQLTQMPLATGVAGANPSGRPGIVPVELSEFCID